MEKLENKLGEGLILKDRSRKDVSHLDEKTSTYVLNAIAKHMGKSFNEETKQQICEQGIQILFRGNAPLGIKEQNYFLFYPSKIEKSARTDLPVKLKVNCYFSPSDHLAIIRKGSPIVGGTLNDNRFTSFSATWLKQAPYQSAAYDFGETVNKMMLNYFNL